MIELYVGAECSLDDAGTPVAVVFQTPAMTRVICRLWCHECCRTFADRITREDGLSCFQLIFLVFNVQNLPNIMLTILSKCIETMFC